MEHTVTTNTLIGAGIVTAIHCVFGTHGILFVLYFALNVLDVLTSWIERYLATEPQKIELAKIALRKVLYWFVIAVAFGMVVAFDEIGEAISIDLGVSQLLGWFVLGVLAVCDLQSMFQSLVNCGIEVPSILIKALTLVKGGLGEKPDVKIEMPEKDRDEEK